MKPIIVTLTQGLGQSLYDGLNEIGELYYWNELSDEQKSEIGPKTEILSIAPMVTVDEAVLGHFPNLKYIASWGVGFDRSDMAAIAKRGIIFTNTPNANFNDVADLTIGLMVGLARHIPQVHQKLLETKSIQWPRRPAFRVAGKKIGIAGFGHIGKELACRAQGFRMQVGYLDRRQASEEFTRFDSVEALAAWADFLVMALPANEQTFHIINANVLEKLGPNGFLINIGRGALVDTEALVQALDNHTIAGAGLDVYENEPNIDPRLTQFENIVLTPHIGGATQEAREDAAQEKLRNIRAYLAGDELVGRIL